MSSLTGVIAEVIEAFVRVLFLIHRRKGNETCITFCKYSIFVSVFGYLDCGLANSFSNAQYIKAYLWATDINKPV